MAKARALDRRRRSVKNIRKITRTMELIATARFKKAMDRSVAARDYTSRLTKILHNIARSGGNRTPAARCAPHKAGRCARSDGQSRSLRRLQFQYYSAIDGRAWSVAQRRGVIPCGRFG